MLSYTGHSHRPVPIVSRPGRGDLTSVMPGLQTRVIIDSGAVGGAYGVLEIVAGPGFSPPRHLHHREDEIVHLQEGCLLLWCDGRSWEAGPGTTAMLPRGVAHSYLVISDTPARMLVTAVPGGMEGFFAAVAGLTLPQDETGLVAAAERFGVQYVGGPLSR